MKLQNFVVFTALLVENFWLDDFRFVAGSDVLFGDLKHAYLISVSCMDFVAILSIVVVLVLTYRSVTPLWCTSNPTSEFPPNMMAFMDLPNEVLGQITTYTLPEGFEGLILTCKLFHALCTPFLAHHNKLRFYFRDFGYYKADGVAKSPLDAVIHFPYSMGSAYNLIEQISVEPIVARYIQNANFDFDNCSTLGVERGSITDDSRIGDIAELLARSPYLKEAGLDWRKYHDEIQNDLNGTKYSQHAAAFVLTLLPNLKKFQLPKHWGSVDATDRLIDAVGGRARQTPLSHENPPSMAQVMKFKSSSFRRSCKRFYLDWAIPFVSLSHVKSFCGPKNAEGHGSGSLVRYLHGGTGMALEEVHLEGASVD